MVETARPLSICQMDLFENYLHRIQMKSIKKINRSILIVRRERKKERKKKIKEGITLYIMCLSSASVERKKERKKERSEVEIETE